MFLQLKKLTKKFKDTTAVKELTLDINKSELIAFLGPSGCGKTTTLKMVGGFFAPDHGSIHLDGQDITRTPPEKRPTATVFQSYALFPHMNVFENVTYGLKFKNFTKQKKKQKGLEVLKLVGLESYYNKSINQLSGGEQQRIALARALVMNPKVLLLDEPLSSLDAKLKIKMRKEIKDIQNEIGITTLYVTHDQEEALSIADKIVVMHEGEVEQIGTPESIYLSPANHFVANFIGRINTINIDKEEILVRPEHIKLSSKKGKHKGQIIHKQFMGLFTTYFVDIGNTVVQTDVFNSENKNWQKNNNVFISFDDSKIISFID